MQKTRLVLIIVGLLLCHSLYGQSDPSKKPEAYKFAEFKNISKAQLQEKIRAFYALLMGEDTSQGFIINYGSAEKIRARKSAIRKTINPRCDFDCPRVTFLDGPDKPVIGTVLWIVPPNPTIKVA